MAAQYVVQIYDTVGALQATVVDYLSLRISRVVSGVDITELLLGSTSLSAQYIVYGAGIEVYRQDLSVGIASYREFSGVIRGITQTITDQTVFNITAVSWAALLTDRQVAYFSGVTNRSQFTAQPSETILKTLWNFNIGASATVANGRFLDGRLTGAAVATSTGTGTAQSISLAQMNLLSAMQKVQLGAGGDFAVSYIAPATWSLEWYLGQLGTDRSATVIFSVSNATIGRLVVKTDRIQDVTATIVAGQGEGSARNMVTRPATLPTGLDLREGFVDARSARSTAEYQQLGTSALASYTRSRLSVEATVLQSDALRYGRDYQFGDLVSVYTGATTLIRKISTITLSLSAMGAEGINVGLTSL